MKLKFKYIIAFILFSGYLLPASAQQKEYPYAEDIQKFKDEDLQNPPPENAILFIGSSSFTIWKDVRDYFPGYTIINRGFGGSTILDQKHYIKDVVFPYNPRQIVIYCGENDIAYSQRVTGQVVANRFKEYYSLLRDKYPKAEITYISMKPSPSRWEMADRFKEGNKLIREFLETEKRADYVDVWDSMLTPDNVPDTSLFLGDQLHMNEKGYKIWQRLIMPVLTKDK